MPTLFWGHSGLGKRRPCSGWPRLSRRCQRKTCLAGGAEAARSVFLEGPRDVGRGWTPQDRGRGCYNNWHQFDHIGIFKNLQTRWALLLRS